ncbi:ABC transporter ATP-binding protein [Pseudaminobacter arsenicus]|uniref:Nickel import system ATP-binding protein NikD n=1 Tax=Borborobacter arsenicus TaxID=1851146 RepID=A0A432V362_9HYPH|nr:ABC transporter ATP-binding protein [Pseudaminobacter arsenicus]RUM96548.1 ABC transporter ATP-binding protein [Pseudaminobacter arsenicus]
MTEILASIRDLGVRYDDAMALAGIDLDILLGERLAIIGESGSGKSTLALAVAGLLPDEAACTGKIKWPRLGHAPQPGRDIGFLFQDAGPSFNPVLTIGEQIAEVARHHLELGWGEAYEYTLHLLERVRMPEPHRALHAYPHQFSGGQRQRLAIAAAIAARPRLLIADEPTSALDTVVQAQIIGLLDGLIREAGMTLLFITHDIALASGFADRIAVFHDGRIVEAGNASRVLARPQAGYTARLLASHIDLDTPPLVSGYPA